MDLVESLRMAVSTIKAHKVRSILTTLGVLIGVTAVLGNVAMAKGFNAFLDEEIRGLGANFVAIQSPQGGVVTGGGLQSGEEQYFDEHTYETLSDLPHVEGATAGRGALGTVRYMDEEKDLVVSGVKHGYWEARDIEILEGDSLGHQDKFTAVVSKPVVEEEFKKPIVVFSTIEITLRTDTQEEVTEEFKVRGICGELGEFNPMEIDVYIPISTFNDMTDEEGYTDIGLFAEDEDHVGAVKMEAIKTLDRLLKVEPKRTFEREVTQEEVNPLTGGFKAEEAVAEERENYTITSQDDVLTFAHNISSTFNLLFIGIASISLLVGGIGIANIMLVTVAERTREIGVMKAVGAKNRDVLLLFLLEAGLIGLIGGAVGLGFGHLFAQILVPALLDIKGILPLEWVGIALGLSFGVGVTSGFYPALRASRMDPVEALSYE